MSTPDLSGPAPDLSGARRLQARKHSAVGLPVAGLLVLGVVGLVMVGVATSKVGVVPAVVGSLAALIPVGVVFGAIVWIDRWEPEPPGLMLGAFLWGAGGATACALVLNDSVVGLGELLFGPDKRVFFERALMAPLVEEGAKALFVVALWFRRRSEFNGLVDGIVYAGLTAAGFAFTENILYFGKAFADGGLGSAAGGVVAVFILRGILAPFSHPLFTSMVGLGIGLASRTTDTRRRLLWPVLGYVAAVVLHAAWNASTLLGGTGFLNVYFLIMVPIFAGTGWLVVWQRKREERIVRDQLPVLHRAGLIARSELDLLASLAGRLGWQRKVRRSAGAEAAKAVRDYQIAVTELAFLQHRAAEGRTTSAVRRARREQLIEELKEARRSAVGSREAFQTARVKIGELTQGVRRSEAVPAELDGDLGADRSARQETGFPGGSPADSRRARPGRDQAAAAPNPARPDQQMSDVDGEARRAPDRAGRPGAARQVPEAWPGQGQGSPQAGNPGSRPNMPPPGFPEQQRPPARSPQGDAGPEQPRRRPAGGPAAEGARPQQPRSPGRSEQHHGRLDPQAEHRPERARPAHEQPRADASSEQARPRPEQVRDERPRQDRARPEQGAANQPGEPARPGQIRQSGSLEPPRERARADQPGPGQRPERGRPEQRRPEQRRDDHHRSEQGPPEQARPDQPRPDQARPEPPRPAAHPDRPAEPEQRRAAERSRPEQRPVSPHRPQPPQR